MRTWLIHIGEDLPTDNTRRTYRYGYLAQALLQRGHQVLRWAPTFRHATKQHRSKHDRLDPLGDGYAQQLVYAPGYARNISLARLRCYRQLAKRFLQLAPRHQPPDVMVAAIPSLEWAQAALTYGQQCGARVVIDTRDIWPDIFVNAFPAVIRSLSRPLLWRSFQQARQICQQADALTAVSSTYLRWALRLAQREAQATDQVFPLGYEPISLSDKERQAAWLPLAEMGIDPRRPTCIFAGLFEQSCDLATVIDAARILQTEQKASWQFVLCGDGRHRRQWMRRAAGLNQIFFPGWVDAPTLQTLLQFSAVGLCAYAPDATQSLPNKPFEYMASQLAVVSSLGGEMAELITRHRCGLNYQATNPESLANCLTQLASDSEQLKQMQNRALNVWQEHYRCDALYREWACFLENQLKLTPLSHRPAA